MRALVARAATLVLLPSVAAAGGLGEYRFGMTPEEVKAVKGCGPYKPIGTGDVECPSFDLGGRKRNLSFHFPGGHLEKIQVWFAEGASRSDAEKATDELIDFLAKSFGELESPSVPPGASVSRGALFQALDKQGADTSAKVQLKPKKGPEGVFVFASIFRDPKIGHMVFLYYARPK